MDLLCDYLALAAQRAAGHSLNETQHQRWVGLLRLLPGTSDPHTPSAAPPVTPDDEPDADGTPVELTTDTGFGAARLMAVSRDGLRLRSHTPLPVGARTVVRVVLGRLGLEYTFPCVVAWRTRTAMGLSFDGTPARGPLRQTQPRGWLSPLALHTGWGRRPAMGLA